MDVFVKLRVRLSIVAYTKAEVNNAMIRTIPLF